jgi:hypothetical protein
VLKKAGVLHPSVYFIQGNRISDFRIRLYVPLLKLRDEQRGFYPYRMARNLSTQLPVGQSVSTPML